MKAHLYRLSSWAWPLLLVLALCGCTANTTETDENGLRPHVTVDLSLPEKPETGIPGLYFVKVSKSGKPLRHAEQADFVIWPEGKEESAVTVKAEETSPGVYSVSHTIEVEGIYLIQSRINADGEQVMPAKRIAIGAHAVEQLAVMEAAQKSGTAAPADAGGHHHH
ncbi:FixH family protein [Paenibacillus arenilitoris]|uniref:FixH family protein n=1 Tax=Paenibacillus arenilitoris TaxID=2772299 RepID=A0A927CQ48_9BACL|nr:FixH family protein [Paenibacillus arenilitoris]MBD2870216.1 FixH family protein [Paenibacillus arenilitoris]